MKAPSLINPDTATGTNILLLGTNTITSVSAADKGRLGRSGTGSKKNPG